MAEINFEIKVQGDSDGYISFECPYCGSDFKLKADEFQTDNSVYSEMYCPYCGLNGEPNNFYTDDVIEQIQVIATNYMYEELNKSFGKMAKELNKSNFIKMTYKPLKKLNVKDLKTEDGVEKIFKCKNCNNHVKVLYCSGISKVFCSYCGECI